MRKYNGIIEAAMRYRVLILIATGLLVLFGVYSLFVMPKQEFPVFTIRQGIVVAVYPGASSSEAEEQVAKPLERFLFNFPEVNKKKTSTMSREGIVYVMVELNDNVNNKDEVWSKIKHGLNEFKPQLPSGVMALIAQDDFGDTSALLISVESEDKTYRELEGYLDDLEDRLRNIETVSNIRRYGVKKEQINIYPDKDKMTAYKINMSSLISRLISQGVTTMSGEFETADNVIPVHFTPVLNSESELGRQIIRTDEKGNYLRLKDIARIERCYDLSENYILNNGVKSVILSLEMREGYNIVEYGKQVETILNSFEAELPESVSIKRIADQPKVVNDSIRSFIKDLMVSILIVIIVMMILFPFRSAVVSAISIPVSIFITIGIMYVCGIPLNTVTLAALIVVLGMIVDNAIIVVDAYLERLDKGMSRWHAAITSAKDYFRSIFLATLCIAVVFFPLLFTMKGQFLDFVEFFPWTIFISLMISFAVAMILIPILEYGMIKSGLKNRNNENPGKRFNLLDLVQKGYDVVLGYTFRFPSVTLSLGVISVIAGVLLLNNLDKRMMPIADRDQFAVEFYLPQGSSLEKTSQITDSVYSILSEDDRITSITSFIGCSSPRFQTSYAPNLPSKNYAQFIVNTISEQATVELLDEYSSYSDYFPEAYVRFKQLDYQNVQIPVEVRLYGKDIKELKSAADILMKEMHNIKEIEWIHTNYNELQPTVNIDLDPVRAGKLGINKPYASIETAIASKGISGGTVWEKDYPVAVEIKNEKAESKELNIEDVYISTSIPGISVPLRDVADVYYDWDEGQIVRRNGMRCISVFASVKRGNNESAAFSKVVDLTNEVIVPENNENITVEYGGTIEGDKDVVNPVIKTVIISVIIILLFMVVYFKKLKLALTAVGSVSLCALGGALGLAVFNVDFSMTCVLGFISMLGIIVRNSILIFEHAENLQFNHHFSAKDAAYDAGKRRMLPIFLTSATTAAGVIPMIVSNSSLWAPMGAVICIGTIVSMILVVTILPVLYWKVYGNK